MNFNIIDRKILLNNININIIDNFTLKKIGILIIY